tara:strand:- start:190 stop:864 length:675 start_codon:yes stop_codon:yes gene_type:complete
MKNFIVAITMLISLGVFSQPIDSLNFNLTIVNPDTIPEVGAKVELKFVTGTLRGTVDDEGKVGFRIPQGSTFDLTVLQYDTIFPFGTIALDPSKPYQEVNYGLTIQKVIHYIRTYDLNIHFGSNMSAVREEDKQILNQLVDTLNANPTMSIEIAAHTDSDGGDDFNQLLSQKRASSVKEYLIGKGIEEMRMTAKGYGEKQPINDNSTPEGKADNRRTEIRVITK